jgi:catechol 2,3-dioxygenase-like lactoylglutathione lyase family enzyme
VGGDTLTLVDEYDRVTSIDQRQSISRIHPEDTPMSRVQLALNVSDLDAAIDYYTKLFATEPAKVRPGYANFAIAEPPLKLVLMEGQGPAGSLNHLGVEVAGPDEVAAATRRLDHDGLAEATEEGVSCCYAVQDKVWSSGPDGEAWEIYTVLADADQLSSDALCCTTAPASDAGCCA